WRRAGRRRRAEAAVSAAGDAGAGMGDLTAGGQTPAQGCRGAGQAPEGYVVVAGVRDGAAGGGRAGGMGPGVGVGAGTRGGGAGVAGGGRGGGGGGCLPRSSWGGARTDMTGPAAGEKNPPGAT